MKSILVFIVLVAGGYFVYQGQMDKKEEGPVAVVPQELPIPKGSAKEAESPAEKALAESEVVTKKVMKPGLEIKVVADHLTGIAPLTVAFEVRVSDASQVKGTYVSIDGKEQVVAGVVKPISHAFSFPGQYPVFFAFKTLDGQVIEQQMTIVVREQTFQEFKEELAKDKKAFLND